MVLWHLWIRCCLLSEVFGVSDFLDFGFSGFALFLGFLPFLGFGSSSRFCGFWVFVIGYGVNLGFGIFWVA